MGWKEEMRSCLDRMTFAAIKGMKDGDPEKIFTSEILKAKEDAHILLGDPCKRLLADCAGCAGR